MLLEGSALKSSSVRCRRISIILFVLRSEDSAGPAPVTRPLRPETIEPAAGLNVGVGSCANEGAKDDDAQQNKAELIRDLLRNAGVFNFFMEIPYRSLFEEFHLVDLSARSLSTPDV